MYRLEWRDQDYFLVQGPYDIPLGMIWERHPTGPWQAIARPDGAEFPTADEAQQWVEAKVRENLMQLLEVKG